MIPGVFAAGAAGSRGEGDPHWANVAALLHMDGPNNSTTFTDETGKIWTPAGDAKVSTAQAKFGQSAAFDGSGDWIDGPSSADFTFGTGDFTIEGWAYWTASNSRSVIGFGVGLSIYRANNGVCYFFDPAIGNNVVLAGINPSLNNWHHFLLSRASGTVRLFLNGTSGSPATWATNVTTSNMRIGANASGGANMSGYIDEVRVTKGVARYTSNFTPPAAPFPNFGP